MKKEYFYFWLFAFIIIFFSSCSSTSRITQGRNIGFKLNNINLVKYNNFPQSLSTTVKVIKQFEDSTITVTTTENLNAENSNLDLIENNSSYQIDELNTNNSEPNNTNLNTKDTNEICDAIILNNGDEISAKILEITPETIKYKKCENLDGPIYVENKSNIFMIKFSNGTKEVYKTIPIEKEITQEKDNRKVPASIVIGFIASLLGLYAFGIPLGIIALILGNVGIAKVNNNGKKYKGSGLAVAAIIIGLADIILTLIVLTKM